ncbi:F0F1 ATP synthase subunit epsilon [Vannielia sp.]|uniref:F0F1 ATP synthase subunit epsilon n=1 Tax=Vannielia sp. TaxID=2813045 RepID=UPI00261C856F|nr:F0F1 ATP synthase subunit epsilon [Vannielia sp.]MDF1873261.1 F0F1 ATP synthase subunit epsilon [Vannielia sp.]
MADTMQFDLVSPERRLASLSVREVQIPGAEGDLTAMPQHTPLITTLRPGLLVVKAEDGKESKYAVLGGFAEINPEATSVLAEHAVPADEMTAEVLEQFMADAAAMRETATAEQLDVLAKTAADIAALGAELGFSVKPAA